MLSSYVPLFASVLLIVYAAMLYIFPPRYMNFWYGVSTRQTRLNKEVWAVGQRMYAYAIFATGVILTNLSIFIPDKAHPLAMLYFLIGLWMLSRFVVEKILEKKYSSAA